MVEMEVPPGEQVGVPSRQSANSGRHSEHNKDRMSSHSPRVSNKDRQSAQSVQNSTKDRQSAQSVHNSTKDRQSAQSVQNSTKERQSAQSLQNGTKDRQSAQSQQSNSKSRQSVQSLQASTKGRQSTHSQQAADNIEATSAKTRLSVRSNEIEGEISPAGDGTRSPSGVHKGGDDQDRKMSSYKKKSHRSIKSSMTHANVGRIEHEPHSKDRIRQDVFLTDYTVPRMNSNLLANSLQARMRKTIPFDLRDNKEALHKVKRDSMRDMIQLAVLDKQYQAEMHRQKSVFRTQESQIRRRLQVLRKRTELNKVSNERIQAQIRARTEPIIILPKLNPTGTTSAPPDCDTDINDNITREITSFSPACNEKPEEIQNLENSIMMVRNCQSPGAFLNEVNEIRNRKKTKRKPEDIEMMTDDSSSTMSAARNRNGIRSVVNFSVKGSVIAPESIDGRHTFSAPPKLGLPTLAAQTQQKSFMDNSQGQNITGTGVGWRIPSTDQSTKSKKQSKRNMSNYKKVSKDLHPVTTLMNRFGLSQKQTAAHVPDFGEATPSVVLPKDVSKYLTPVEMANHVARFRKKYPLPKHAVHENEHNKGASHDDDKNSTGQGSGKTDQGYSMGSGMSTNRSVTSQNMD